MSYINTEAVVLAKLPLREADRLYVLYTPEHGKIEARLKAAASTASKLAGSLEPIALVKAMIAKGRQRETIAGAQLLKHFNTGELDLYGQTGLVRELFLKMVRPAVKEPRLFGNLWGYLLALEKNRHYPLTCRFLTMRFVWQFLNIAGFSSIAQVISQFPAKDEATKLLKGCLAAKPTGALQVSHNLLQKLEDFTANYLRQILEQDLSYSSFLSYERISQS